MKFVRIFVFIFVSVIFSITAQGAVIDSDLPNIYYVNFKSLPSTTYSQIIVSGQLRVPKASNEARMPAVVISHGSGGVDSRGKFYAEALNAAGIATLEIDMWAARGWFGGTLNRPAGVPETLPDAYGALKFLSEVPNIDPDRIGIMGFSWGGVVAMLTATTPYTVKLYGGELNGLKFAAHIAHYPVCWVYNLLPGYEFKEFTGAPVLIQSGELDDYDVDPDTCPNLAASTNADFISVNIYPHATHAWDRLQPAMTVIDPYSHQGAGGEVDIVPNPGKAFQARDNAVGFFRQAFGMSDKIKAKKN